MSILTITSKAVRNTVVLYMGTAMGQKIIQPHTVSHADPPPLDDHPMYIDQFINLGQFTQFYGHLCNPCK